MKRILPWIVPLSLLALWQAASTSDLLQPQVLPAPTAVVEAAEAPMIALMRSLGCEVIPCPFDRVYAFGGGFHCCTADIRRDGRMQSYFPSLDATAAGR